MPGSFLTERPSRERLVLTMHHTARWRRNSRHEFANDGTTRRRSYRAVVAIPTAAKFVEAHPDDNRDLGYAA
jgi:hypothetical protein